MRVALCTDGIHPHALGGMQKHSRLLAEHLARSGKVRLVVLHPHAEQVFDPSLGIEEVRVPDIDRSRFYLRELWRYSGQIAEHLVAIQPDVILSQGFCVWKDIGSFSDRLILHPHGLEMFQVLTWKERLLGWPFRAALRYMTRRSMVVVSLGGKLTGILEKQVSGSNARVIVIPNAVDLRSNARNGQRATSTPSTLRQAQGSGQAQQRTTLTLLFVGRFAFNKGLDVLMDVATRLVAGGKGDLVRFQLAGDGPLMRHYLDAGLPPNVELLGRVDDGRLQQLYHDCDALILPTRFEGMPTVVLEAMAAAKPIIVSDVGATAELVDAGNGFLVPPGDGRALMDAITALMALGADQRRRMGEASLARVQERFTWEVVTRRFEELFAGLRSAPRSAAGR